MLFYIDEIRVLIGTVMLWFKTKQLKNTPTFNINGTYYKFEKQVNNVVRVYI